MGARVGNAESSERRRRRRGLRGGRRSATLAARLAGAAPCRWLVMAMFGGCVARYERVASVRLLQHVTMFAVPRSISLLIVRPILTVLALQQKDEEAGRKHAEGLKREINGKMTPMAKL